MGACVCTPLVATNLVARGYGAGTEFSIQLVHRTAGDSESCLTCSARESILRARDEDNLLIQYAWNTSFTYGSRLLNWKTYSF